MKSIHTFVVLAYKNSIFLENCIKSCLNQKYMSNVIIATSTPNKYIYDIAKKYNLNVVVNDGKHGIGYDFDFAVRSGKTDLVTVAHQDDIYDYEYSYKVVNEYNKYNDAIIIFTDYYEIRGKDSKKVYKNKNLKIKRILLNPIKIKMFSKFKLNKRLILALGNSICCPAVTFVKKNVPDIIFESDMKCNIDWLAWERLSKLKGRFIYVNDNLMGHRIYNGSTTSEVLKDDGRSKEDYFMYRKFWIKPIAKFLTKLYKNSEKSNNE